MKLRKNQRGVGHHFILPLLAILLVGAIGAYLTFQSRAALGDPPRYKKGLVDDGPYASRKGASAVRDYLKGGSSNQYAFAINEGQLYHTVLNVGVKELVNVKNNGATTYIAGSLESRIDNAIKWNKANPTKRLNVHIRFHVGDRAPDKWKELCGTVRMADPQFGVAADAPRWWVKKEGKYVYRELYANAMTVLAKAVKDINARDDIKNIIGTVNAPGAAPNYPEPMILYASSAGIRRALLGGGYTAAEHNSFMTWFPTAAAPFESVGVGVELAVNPYQNITADGKYLSSDTKMYKEVAQALIDTVGAENTVIANYSAREAYTRSGLNGAYPDMYSWMSSLAKASDPVWVGVQMARPHNVAMGNSDTNEQWDDVAKWAAAQGFHFAETTGPRAKSAAKPAPHGLANLWPKSYNDDSDDIQSMKDIRKAFMKNPRPSEGTTDDEPTTPPPTGTDPGYISIIWARTAWQAANGKGCTDTAGTRTLLQNAEDMKARGLFGVGGVVLSRTPDTGNPCFANYMTRSSWADMANLRDNYNWKFISQGMNYANMTKMTKDSDRYNESGATLPLLEAKGHNRSWGAFNYANNKQDSAAQKVVTKYFGFGRKYGGGQNTKAKVTKAPYIMNTNSVNGGRCHNPDLACYSMRVVNDRRSTSVELLANVLSPKRADQWGVVQFYRLVEGKRGAIGDNFAWDCTSTDWKNRWTSQPELFCRESFLEVMDKRTTSATVADPATVAEAWDRIPSERRS